METTLDKFGRVVIPKGIRDNLGLKPGEMFKVEKSGGEVILKPLREETSIKIKDGVMVYAGTATGDIIEAVRAHREEHLKKAALPGRK